MNNKTPLDSTKMNDARKRKKPRKYETKKEKLLARNERERGLRFTVDIGVCNKTKWERLKKLSNCNRNVTFAAMLLECYEKARVPVSSDAKIVLTSSLDHECTDLLETKSDSTVTAPNPSPLMSDVSEAESGTCEETKQKQVGTESQSAILFQSRKNIFFHKVPVSQGKDVKHKRDNTNNAAENVPDAESSLFYSTVKMEPNCDIDNKVQVTTNIDNTLTAVCVCDKPPVVKTEPSSLEEHQAADHNHEKHNRDSPTTAGVIDIEMTARQKSCGDLGSEIPSEAAYGDVVTAVDSTAFIEEHSSSETESASEKPDEYLWMRVHSGSETESSPELPEKYSFIKEEPPCSETGSLHGKSEEYSESESESLPEQPDPKDVDFTESVEYHTALSEGLIKERQRKRSQRQCHPVTRRVSKQPVEKDGGADAPRSDGELSQSENPESSSYDESSDMEKVNPPEKIQIFIPPDVNPAYTNWEPLPEDHSGHMDISQTRRFPCDRCSREMSMAGLTRHYNLHHEQDKPRLYCNYCQLHLYPFQEKFHKLCAASICSHDSCETLLYNRQFYYIHCSKVHGVARKRVVHSAVCPQCGKQFKGNYSLTTHLRIHTGEKPYICYYCGAAFRQKASWNYHMKKHHPDNTDWQKTTVFSCNLMKKPLRITKGKQALQRNKKGKHKLTEAEGKISQKKKEEKLVRHFSKVTLRVTLEDCMKPRKKLSVSQSYKNLHVQQK